MEVVLVDVVAGVEDVRELALNVRGEGVLQGLNDGAGSQIGAANADHHDHLRFGGHTGGALLNAGDVGLRHIVWKGNPPEEIIAAAGAVERGLERGLSVGLAGARY